MADAAAANTFAVPKCKERFAPGLVDQVIPIESLREDPANARKHDAANLSAIQGSLARFGQQKPVVVRPDGVVVAGNGTLAAARALGWTRIAAVQTDLSGIDVAAYAIADNRTAELASWDLEALNSLMSQMKVTSPASFLASGFTDQTFAELMKDLKKPPTQTDPDAVPAPPDAATTQKGDLWILGDHRLLCGDSGKPEDLDRLLGGAEIHLVNTDPPYNVKVEPRSNNAIAAGLSSFQATNTAPQTHHQALDLAKRPGASIPSHKLRAKDRPLANDFVSDEAFDEMLLAWFGNLARVLIEGGAFYIWGGYSNYANYPPALAACDLYCSQVIIWDKEHPVLTRKDFMGAHESCFYGWKKGAGHRWFGPNNATDLWHVKKVNPQSMVHLTEKPVELATRAMEYSSKRGENVLDLFGGSGSTLIGAEKTGRHAFLMELDELYCDVIVTRWEEYTGKKATREAKA